MIKYCAYIHGNLYFVQQHKLHQTFGLKKVFPSMENVPYSNAANSVHIYHDTHRQHQKKKKQKGSDKSLLLRSTSF